MNKYGKAILDNGNYELIEDTCLAGAYKDRLSNAVFNIGDNIFEIGYYLDSKDVTDYGIEILDFYWLNKSYRLSISLYYKNDSVSITLEDNTITVTSMGQDIMSLTRHFSYLQKIDCKTNRVKNILCDECTANTIVNEIYHAFNKEINNKEAKKYFNELFKTCLPALVLRINDFKNVWMNEINDSVNKEKAELAKIDKEYQEYLAKYQEAHRNLTLSIEMSEAIRDNLTYECEIDTNKTRKM